MMIANVQIEKIKFDKSQPRQFVDQTRVAEMAQNILSQGVINPIEIDENFVIVTGELRFRAAKEAGLTEVPCKIITISSDNRFERQLAENIHHNTMSDWDTAKALKKLLSTWVRHLEFDKGISELSRRMGKSHRWVRDMLSILEADEDIRNAVEKRQIGSVVANELHNSSESIRKILTPKIISKEIGRDSLRAIKKAVADNPEKEQEILKMDFKDKNVDAVKKELGKIAPTFEDKADDLNEYLEKLENHAYQIIRLLERPPQETAKDGLLEFNAKLTIGKLGQLYELLASKINPKLHE